MQKQERGLVLSLLAASYVPVALQSLAKPFQSGPLQSFMLLGTRTDGLVEAIAAPCHAGLLLALAYGIWSMRAFSLPLAALYAAYVPVNILLYVSNYGFSLQDAAPPGQGQSTNAVALYAIAWLVLALGGPAITAFLLYRKRAALS